MRSLSAREPEAAGLAATASCSAQAEAAFWGIACQTGSSQAFWGARPWPLSPLQTAAAFKGLQSDVHLPGLCKLRAHQLVAFPWCWTAVQALQGRSKVWSVFSAVALTGGAALEPWVLLAAMAEAMQKLYRLISGRRVQLPGSALLLQLHRVPCA